MNKSNIDSLKKLQSAGSDSRSFNNNEPLNPALFSGQNFDATRLPFPNNVFRGDRMLLSSSLFNGAGTTIQNSSNNNNNSSICNKNEGISFLGGSRMSDTNSMLMNPSQPNDPSLLELLAEENRILKRRLLLQESLSQNLGGNSCDPARILSSCHQNPSLLVAAAAALQQQQAQSLKLPSSLSGPNGSTNSGMSSLHDACNLARTLAQQQQPSLLNLPASLGLSSNASSLLIGNKEKDRSSNSNDSNDGKSAIISKGCTMEDAKLQSAAARVPRDALPTSPMDSVSFPLKLYKMLMDAESRNLSNVVCFAPDGKSFRVVDRHRFVKEIMPHYFKMKQFASFHRQLNFYSFQRIHRGTEQSAFYHELFQRDKPQLLHRMKRKRQRVPGAAAASLSASLASKLLDSSRSDNGDAHHYNDKMDEDQALALKALLGIHQNPSLMLNARQMQEQKQQSGGSLFDSKIS